MPKHISDQFLQLMANKFQMLSDPTRLSILHVLMRGERNVSEIVAATHHGQANVSKHLGLLLKSGMVSRRKEGLNVFYKVQDPVVERICDLVCKVIAKDSDRLLLQARQYTIGK